MGEFDLFRISAWILPVLLAVTLHEAAHGWAAWRLGDDTALRLGRVSFNPIRHVDPVGTVALPGLLVLMGAPFLFGWAKPVPVAFRRLGNPRRDMALVAAAGPAMNLALAAACIVALGLLPQESLSDESLTEWIGLNLIFGLTINAMLAVFNLLPLPPLDGGRIAVAVLPDALAAPLARLERYGMLIVLLAFVALPLAAEAARLDIPLPIHALAEAARWLIDGLIQVFGP